MSRREFSFRVNGITICFVQLYSDCWICSLPNMIAKELELKTTPYVQLPIDKLNLSNRAMNVLKNNDLKTVYDILATGYIGRLPGLGPVTRKEIIAELEKHQIPVEGL